MTAPLGVGIIGLGGIGRIHAQAVATLPDLGVVRAVARASDDALAACDLSPAQRASVDDMLADPAVDVVAICTPSSTHAELGFQAIDAGKHVVVEKPLALTAADARELVRRAEERGLRVIGISQRRFEPQNIEIRERMRQGRLGTPLLAEIVVPWFRDDAYYAAAPWRTEPDGGGGSLANQGLHTLDLALMFLGRVTVVTAQSATQTHAIDVEDITTATLRFASGAHGILATTTSTHPGYPARLGVYTSTGRVELEGDAISTWTFDDRPRTGEPIPGGASDPLAIGAAGHIAQWRDVLTALRDGSEPFVGPRDGLHTTEVIDAIYRSAASATAITL